MMFCISQNPFQYGCNQWFLFRGEECVGETSYSSLNGNLDVK